MNHIIKKQTLIMEIPSQVDSWKMSDHFKDIFNREVLPRLEKVCDEMGFNQQFTLKLDKLSIDVGSINSQEIAETWAETIEHSFRKELQNYTSEKLNSEEQQVLLSPEQSEIEIFSHFLENGVLPWYVSDQYTETPQALFTKLLANQPKALVSKIHQSKQKSVISKRLLHQFNFDKIRQLLEHFEKTVLAPALDWVATEIQQIKSIDFKVLEAPLLLIRTVITIDRATHSHNETWLFQLLFEQSMATENSVAQSTLINLHKHLNNKYLKTNKKQSVEYDKYCSAALKALEIAVSDLKADTDKLNPEDRNQESRPSHPTRQEATSKTDKKNEIPSVDGNDQNKEEDQEVNTTTNLSFNANEIKQPENPTKTVSQDQRVWEHIERIKKTQSNPTTSAPLDNDKREQSEDQGPLDQTNENPTKTVTQDERVREHIERIKKTQSNPTTNAPFDNDKTEQLEGQEPEDETNRDLTNTVPQDQQVGKHIERIKKTQANSATSAPLDNDKTEQLEGQEPEDQTNRDHTNTVPQDQQVGKHIERIKKTQANPTTSAPFDNDQTEQQVDHEPEDQTNENPAKTVTQDEPIWEHIERIKKTQSNPTTSAPFDSNKREQPEDQKLEDQTNRNPIKTATQDERVWEHIERIKQAQLNQIKTEKQLGEEKPKDSPDSETPSTSVSKKGEQPSPVDPSVSTSNMSNGIPNNEQGPLDTTHRDKAETKITNESNEQRSSIAKEETEAKAITTVSVERNSKAQSEPHVSDTQQENELNATHTEQQSENLKYWQNQLESIDECYVQNAGLIIFWPYLGHFFNDMGFTKDSRFKSPYQQQQAALSLQYLLSKEPELKEHLLPINKLLCGLAISEPISSQFSLDEDGRTKCEDLIQTAIDNWPALKGTSIEGFQNSFLNRNGVLKKHENHWQLQVEKKAFDMLIEHLPWPISIVKLSWMDKPIYVEW